MWNRKDVKKEGKVAFTSNWFICVLITFIIGAGGISVSYSTSSTNENNDDFMNTWEMVEVEDQPIDHFSLEFSDLPIKVTLTSSIAVPLATIMIILNIFVFNILEIGGAKFFMENSRGLGRIEELLYAFDSKYISHVIIMLKRDIKIILWGLLFIIPGIIKAYEYRMVPYILAENPYMTSKEVFNETKRLMDGNKLDLFIFDWSFIGWKIVSIFTFGLLNIIWTNPYINASEAEIYLSLK